MRTGKITMYIGISKGSVEKGRQTLCITREDWELIQNEEEVAKCWKEYLKELYGDIN